MTAHRSAILVDSGILVAYHNRGDRVHRQVKAFLEQSTSRLLTTLPCVAETMWLLASDWRVQNEFLADLSKELYEWVQLVPDDFERIAALNAQYSDLPGDFADLSLVVVSERLDIAGDRHARQGL